MKYRVLILIASSILVVIVGKNLLGGKEIAPIEAPERAAKIVQTQIVGKSSFTEEVHVTGRVAPIRETVISTQGTGFIGSIAVKIGDRVSVGQVLASISDTYGLSGNAIEEAAIGVTSAQLSNENSLVSLNQAVENARVAYERARKDYAASKLSSGEEGEISKAELDLENYITTQERTLSGYETTYQSQLQSFQSFLANVIDTGDTLLGVTESKRALNDSYEKLLGVLDSIKKTEAEIALQKLLAYKTWTPDPNITLVERVSELQRVYLIANDVLTGLETVLINSVTDSTNFTPAILAADRATIDAYQTQYSTISSGLVTFLNAAQAFLATYEKERLSREKGVEITAANSLDAFELAEKAYETAQRARDIGLAQTQQSLGTAGIHLQNAQGNAARLAITAPFSGVVIAKNAEIGTLASPGINLFTLGDTSTLIIKTDISNDIQKYLKRGQDIPLRFQGEVFTGKLTGLSAGPDPQTHLYRAEITLPKIHPLITLGDIVDVVLPGKPLSENPEDTKIVVPYSALKNLGQETYAVYVVTIEDELSGTGTVHERIVQIGETNENSVTIVSGLEVGEHIVALGTLNVEDGDLVQEPRVGGNASNEATVEEKTL